MKTFKIFIVLVSFLTIQSLTAQIKINTSGNVGVGGEPNSKNLNVSGTMQISNTITSSKSSGTLFHSSNTGVQQIQLTNDDIRGVNLIEINDLGAGEGISWKNGKVISIHDVSSGNSHNAFTFASTNSYPFHFTGANVGIGITSPSYKLHTEGDIYVDNGWLRTSGQKGIYFQSYGGGLYMKDATWIRTYNNKSFYHNSGTMRTDGTFQVGSSGSRFIVNTSGNVGIGKTSPSCKLDVEGIIKTNGVTVTSDGRFKKDIKDMNSNLNSIKKMRPVSYKMKKLEKETRVLTAEEMLLEEDLNIDNNSPLDSLAIASLPKETTTKEEQIESPNLEDDYYSRNRMGFLAQDMEAIYPELVYTDEDGYKSIDYISLIPVLVAGIQEQQKLIEDQQREIEKLKGLN